MGASTSRQSTEIEDKVYQELRGTLLRGSRNMSPIQELLQSSLYHAYGSPQTRLKSLYVVRNGGEMERFGLLPTFQKGNDKFIVRPLRKEFIDGSDRFRVATRQVNQGTIAIYSVIASMLAISGLALASHTKDYKDLINELKTEDKKDDIPQIDYPNLIINSIRKYSLQKNNKNVNPREQNIMFAMDQYSSIIPTMLKKIEGKYSLKTPKLRSDILLHTGILNAIDSFSICSQSPNSLKNMLRTLKKGGGLDGIVSTMNNVLSKDVVRTWLDDHPSLKNQFATVLASTIRSSRIISRGDTNLSSIVMDIITNMRQHVVNACKTNERLSSYSSQKNVLIKSSKTNKYEYSKEANNMIVRIYQRFEKITRTMQSEILNTFMNIFVISNKEIPNTVNIQSNTNSYISIKPEILKAKDPGIIIMTGLLKMVESYTKYIVNINQTLQNTINQRTRVL